MGNNTNRLVWLDVAKCIAIILMVIGHTSIPKQANNFIFAFHMPLFFIASGWTTNWNKYTIREFINRRIRTLLLPFVIYSTIVLMIQIHFEWMTMDEWLSNGWGGIALWFIPVLFLASIIAKILYTLKEIGEGLFWVAVILLLFVGIDLSYYQIRLPWALSTVFYAVFLIVLGSEWGKTEIEYGLKRKQLLMTIVAILIVGLISHFWRLDLRANRISPTFPLTIGAIAGSYMVFVLSRLLCCTESCVTKVVSNLLQKVGTETYIIVAFSQIIIMLINHYASTNMIVKYLILIVLLILLSIIKNYIVKLWTKVTMMFSSNSI